MLELNSLIKLILGYVFKESDEELYNQYKLEVLDCHPFTDEPVPITFEEWKDSR